MGQAVTIDIYGPGQSRMNMALAQPLGAGSAAPPAASRELQQLLQQNLSMLPFLELVPSMPSSAGTRLPGTLSTPLILKDFSW